jgi:hypothetical protein
VRYTVVWSGAALAQLAALWNATRDRAITAAQHRIDQQLRTTPRLNADPLAEGLLTLDVPPLRVVFEIEDMDCLVRVLAVKRIP